VILRGHAQAHGDSFGMEGTTVTSVAAGIAYVTSLEHAGWAFDWAEIIDGDRVVATYDGDTWKETP
jgi:hypothetical protein